MHGFRVLAVIAMSQNDSADRKSAPTFGFHQLRQACEISSLRQEITRILTGTADLQILIENEVERVRQRLGALDATESQDSAKLSPLLSDAMAALTEIRDASRRLETSIARRTPDPKPQVPAAELIEQTLRRSFTERQPTAPSLPPRSAPVMPPPAPPPAHEQRQAIEQRLTRQTPAPFNPPLTPALSNPGPQQLLQQPHPTQPSPPPVRAPAHTAKAMNWLAPSKR